jgi:hypothetical protein
MELKYLIEKSLIDEKTQIALKPYLSNDHIDEMVIFPDIHYSNERALPVGVAFSSNKVFPLITGNDIGYGVAYAKISKKDILKTINQLRLILKANT